MIFFIYIRSQCTVVLCLCSISFIPSFSVRRRMSRWSNILNILLCFVALSAEISARFRFGRIISEIFHKKKRHMKYVFVGIQSIRFVSFFIRPEGRCRYFLFSVRIVYSYSKRLLTGFYRMSVLFFFVVRSAVVHISDPVFLCSRGRINPFFDPCRSKRPEFRIFQWQIYRNFPKISDSF